MYSVTWTAASLSSSPSIPCSSKSQACKPTVCIHISIKLLGYKNPFTKFGPTIATLGQETVPCVSAQRITGIRRAKHSCLKKPKKPKNPKKQPKTPQFTKPTTHSYTVSWELTSKACKQAKENWITVTKADAQNIFVHSSWYCEDREHSCCFELLTKKLEERRIPSIINYSMFLVSFFQHCFWLVFLPELRSACSSQEAYMKC